ncbi:hypothetical protein DUNSADRAFT_9112 [Dunaliella salina]|uniref:Uncharacterized protein n=1 Tax=Dunaliella salina TaxID=3046 RepID=A0ABQ7GI48_DUNSA|nr:hypothetical protein DUNSADRAFT_9112 [Dunaliella salina]|eukprot:KAF5834289.1 hypothetical protein DUNSADRAFT_9112 [Dunaliella salina]
MEVDGGTALSAVDQPHSMPGPHVPGSTRAPSVLASVPGPSVPAASLTAHSFTHSPQPHPQPTAPIAPAKLSPSEQRSGSSHTPAKAAAPTSTFSGFFPTQTSGRPGSQGAPPGSGTEAPLRAPARTGGVPQADVGGRRHPQPRHGSASDAHPPPTLHEQPAAPMSGGGAVVEEEMRGSAPGSAAVGHVSMGATSQVRSPSPPFGDASATATAAAAAAAQHEGSQDVLDLSPVPLASQDGGHLSPITTDTDMACSYPHATKRAAADDDDNTNKPMPKHAAATSAAAAAASATSTAPQPASKSAPSVPAHTDALSNLKYSNSQPRIAHQPQAAVSSAGSMPHTTIDGTAGRLYGSGSREAPTVAPGSSREVPPLAPGLGDTAGASAVSTRPDSQQSGSGGHQFAATMPANTSGQPSPVAVTKEPVAAAGAASAHGGTGATQKAQPDALDFCTSLSRLETMLLQAQQMQMDVLEARTQSAVLANKLVRLDNPILRARLSAVAQQHAAATRVRLPGA